MDDGEKRTGAQLRLLPSERSVFLLPALLFTSQRDFRDFLIGTAIFGVVVAAGSLKFSVSGGLVSGIDPSHIGKGQTIGLAMLVLLYAPVTDRRWRAFILLVCIPFLAIGLVSAETQNAPHKASARAKGIAVPIYSPADILEARKKGSELARDLGFSPTDCTLIATAISELARNIVLYAVSGEIHISSASNSAVDGLGHDGEACAAAQLAADALQEYAGLRPLVMLLEDCHEKLRGSRGAIVSVALLNASEDAMTWLGVGSVEGRLLRAPRTGAVPAGKARETLLLSAGVVGHQLPRLAADTLPPFVMPYATA